MPRVIGRYALHDEIASGGMASVHLGKLCGPARFSPIVAIKSLHAPFAKDPDFVSMLLDEARLAARVRHPNVVPVIDVHAGHGELFLVLEYVRGESLLALLRAAWRDGKEVPVAVASAVVCDVLRGLDAAHEATDERGQPLGLVHRDVSPHNVMVGIDGAARVLDFGVAKAAGRMQTTRDGQVKGKLAYMAPEQLRGEAVNRQADVYSAAVVLWEMLAGRRCFQGDSHGATVEQVLFDVVPPPGAHRPAVPGSLDAVVLRGLSRDRSRRFATAKQMALALQAAVTPAASQQVGEWVEGLAFETLEARARVVARIEATVDTSPPPEATPTAAAGTPRRSARLLRMGGLAVAALGVWVLTRSYAPSRRIEAPAPAPVTTATTSGTPSTTPPTPPAVSTAAAPSLPPRSAAAATPGKHGTGPAASPPAPSPTLRCAHRNADGVIEFDTACLRAAQQTP